MRIPRPRSLNGLISIGLVLITLPLLLAIARAAYQMDRLATESEHLLLQGVQATQSSQELQENITAMLRNARLYQVIGDQELIEAYDERQHTLTTTLENLEQLVPIVPLDVIQRVRRDANTIAAGIHAYPADSVQLEEVLGRFARLSRDSVELRSASNRYIDLGLTTLQLNARQAQEALAWQTAALIPGTLVIALIFVLLVSRPIRKIDRAIQELGKGTFSRPIKIKGPSDLESLGRQLEWLRQSLLELAIEKNKVLRHMSHELKTPLANIREGTELLIDGSVGNLSPNQREVATILRDNGLTLQQLIENLLSFSAWQSRNAELELSRFSLHDLLKSVASFHRLVVVSQQIKLDIKADDISLYADRAKLRMILDNLISNASKFTPASGTIYVRARKKQRELVIDVADTGPGIPAEERDRIFEAFYQGKTAQGGRVQGTGIGLSVVLECVHAHGGSVRLVTNRRKYSGAHFRVKMPIEQAATLEDTAINA
ncbi:MAG: ATP-binding protein, partial [Gammaproteobacteria bacterium]